MGMLQGELSWGLRAETIYIFEDFSEDRLSKKLDSN